MESNFGEYITKEYGLLKQILSYLKPCDLHNARFVCKEWRKTVDKLVDKNPLLIITYQHGKEDPMPYPTRPFLPDLVILQNVMSKEYSTRKCRVCKTKYPVCVCEITGPETKVLMLYNLAVTSRYDPDQYLFWQEPSVFLSSSPENIELLVFTGCGSKKNALTKCVSLTDISEPKGIFIILDAKSASRKMTERLLNDVVDKQGLNFALGGGITDGLKCKNVLRCLDGEKTNMVTCIVFKGENVSAYSELIGGDDQDAMEKSMAQLKEKAGEVPEGGTRVAFIAQCVARRSHEQETLESSFFRKYFPGVPQFGFPAFGEIGFKNGSSDDLGPRNRQKRKKMSFEHAYTTSILIVTFRKSLK